MDSKRLGNDLDTERESRREREEQRERETEEQREKESDIRN